MATAREGIYGIDPDDKTHPGQGCTCMECVLEGMEWGSCDNCGSRRHCPTCGVSKGKRHAYDCPVPAAIGRLSQPGTVTWGPRDA